MKTRATKQSDEALAPLIKHGAKSPAFYASTADAMTAQSGERFYRQEVAAWLHPQKAKRTEPRLGAGLLLIQVGTEIMDRGER